jgi:hypothetical protein
MYEMDSWPSFAWTLNIKRLHFLVLNSCRTSSDCITRWTRCLNDWSTGNKENCIQPFLYLMVFSAIHARFDLYASTVYASTISYLLYWQSCIMLYYNLNSSNVCLGNGGCRPPWTVVLFDWQFPSFILYSLKGPNVHICHYLLYICVITISSLHLHII